jgi:hypothetical protein
LQEAGVEEEAAVEVEAEAAQEVAVAEEEAAVEEEAEAAQEEAVVEEDAAVGEGAEAVHLEAVAKKKAEEEEEEAAKERRKKEEAAKQQAEAEEAAKKAKGGAAEAQRKGEEAAFMEQFWKRSKTTVFGELQIVKTMPNYRPDCTMQMALFKSATFRDANNKPVDAKQGSVCSANNQGAATLDGLLVAFVACKRLIDQKTNKPVSGGGNQWEVVAFNQAASSGVRVCTFSARQYVKGGQKRKELFTEEALQECNTETAAWVNADWTQNKDSSSAAKLVPNLFARPEPTANASAAKQAAKKNVSSKDAGKEAARKEKADAFVQKHPVGAALVVQDCCKAWLPATVHKHNLEEQTFM